MNDSVMTASPSRMVTRFISVLLLAFLLIPIAVFAEEEDEDTAPSSGRSAGSRGCGTLTSKTPPTIPSLILLTPDAPAQTVLSRPTFVWHVRDELPVPMIFRLYRHQENQRYELIQEIKDDTFKTSPGLLVLPWPDSAPPLQLGRYHWQVSLICDPSRPSGNLFAGSDLEVVPMPSRLSTQLRTLPHHASRSQVYSQANFWFDALGSAFASMASSQSGRFAQADPPSAILEHMTLDVSERQILQNSAVRSIQR